MVLVEYLYWHYAVAPAGILKIFSNYLIGTWHRFLIHRHLRTLFAPWHRLLPSQLPEQETVFTRISDFFADIVVRFLAAAVRISIVISGLIYEAVLIAVFSLLLLIWVLWPIILIYSVLTGIKLL